MPDIQVYIENEGREKTVPAGSTLLSFAPKEVEDPKTGKKYPTLAALVDHKLKALDFPVFYPHQIEFIGFNHPEGRRTYGRSLSFLAQVAARHLFPEKIFKINHSLPSGMYCKFRAEHIPDEEILRLREEMRRLVALDLPFGHQKMLAEEAIKLFERQRQPLKAGVVRSLGRYFWTVYTLDDVTDNFYGPLVPSTGFLKVFDLMPFHHGFCLQPPMEEDITRVIPRTKQKKLTITLKEYGRQGELPGIAHCQYYSVCKESIQTHAWGKYERQFGVDSHHRCTHNGRENGRCKHGTLIHTSICKNAWVHGKDIRHGQECGDSGNNLLLHRHCLGIKSKNLLKHSFFVLLLLLINNYRLNFTASVGLMKKVLSL